MRKVNKTVLALMIILALCTGDLIITAIPVITGILTGHSVGLSCFGCIISFTEIMICEVCHEELETRYKRLSI